LMELLTITHWVEVRGDFGWYWWNCWPSLNEIRWEVIFVDIGGIVNHHSMSWSERWHFNSMSDGQQFHQYQQTPPLTSTHWVIVNNSTNINKITSHLNSLSDGQQFHQYQITSHLNSLSDGHQFHQYQQKSPLTSTHSVMVNNFSNISKHHLSP
jgi:hypothetical protein